MAESMRSQEYRLFAAAAILAAVICSAYLLAPADADAGDASGTGLLGIPSDAIELKSDTTVHDGEHYYVRGDLEMEDSGWEDETYSIYLTAGSTIQLADSLRGTWILCLAAGGDGFAAPTEYYSSLHVVACDGGCYGASSDGPYIDGPGAREWSCGIYAHSSAFGMRWYPDGADAGKIDITPKYSEVSITNGSCIAEGYLCSVELKDIVSDDAVNVTTPRWQDGSDNTDIIITGGNDGKAVFVESQDDDDDDGYYGTEKKGEWVVLHPATTGKITMLWGYCSLTATLEHIAHGAVEESDGLWTSYEYIESGGWHTVSLRGDVTLEGRTVPESVKVVYDCDVSLGEVTVNGSLISSGKATIGVLKGTGTVSAKGGVETKDMAIGESKTIDGDLRCGSLTIDGGALTVNGSLSCGDVSIGKGCKLAVKGNMTSDDLVVADGGTLTVGGELSCTEAKSLGAETSHSIKAMGTISVKSDLAYDEAFVSGTLDVDGSLDIKSIKVNGCLDVEGGIRTGTFVAEEGHDVSGDISAETMIVPAGVEFVTGCSLDADALIILGTFRAEIPFSAEKIFVGMSMTSDSPAVGSASALIVPDGMAVTGLSALYVAEGSTAAGLTDSMAATKYIVDGIAYATAYMPSGGSAKISDLRVPAFNGTVASEWTCTADGKEAPVGDMLVGGAGEVHASLCAVAVSVGEGLAKVFIDKAEVPVNGGSVSLSPGTHTISWETESGYSGKDVAVSYNGQPVSGGTITVSDSDGTASISLACAQESSVDGGQHISTVAIIAVLAAILAAAAVGYWAVKH